MQLPTLPRYRCPDRCTGVSFPAVRSMAGVLVSTFESIKVDSNHPLYQSRYSGYKMRVHGVLTAASARGHAMMEKLVI